MDLGTWLQVRANLSAGRLRQARQACAQNMIESLAQLRRLSKEDYRDTFPQTGIRSAIARALDDAEGNDDGAEAETSKVLAGGQLVVRRPGSSPKLDSALSSGPTSQGAQQLVVQQQRLMWEQQQQQLLWQQQQQIQWQQQQEQMLHAQQKQQLQQEMLQMQDQQFQQQQQQQDQAVQIQQRQRLEQEMLQMQDQQFQQQQRQQEQTLQLQQRLKLQQDSLQAQEWQWQQQMQQQQEETLRLQQQQDLLQTKDGLQQQQQQAQALRLQQQHEMQQQRLRALQQQVASSTSLRANIGLGSSINGVGNSNSLLSSPVQQLRAVPTRNVQNPNTKQNYQLSPDVLSRLRKLKTGALQPRQEPREHRQPQPTPSVPDVDSNVDSSNYQTSDDETDTEEEEKQDLNPAHLLPASAPRSTQQQRRRHTHFASGSSGGSSGGSSRRLSHTSRSRSASLSSPQLRHGQQQGEIARMVAAAKTDAEASALSAIATSRTAAEAEGIAAGAAASISAEVVEEEDWWSAMSNIRRASSFQHSAIATGRREPPPAPSPRHQSPQHQSQQQREAQDQQAAEHRSTQQQRRRHTHFASGSSGGSSRRLSHTSRSRSASLSSPQLRHGQQQGEIARMVAAAKTDAEASALSAIATSRTAAEAEGIAAGAAASISAEVVEEEDWWSAMSNIRRASSFQHSAIATGRWEPPPAPSPQHQSPQHQSQQQREVEEDDEEGSWWAEMGNLRRASTFQQAPRTPADRANKPPVAALGAVPAGGVQGGDAAADADEEDDWWAAMSNIRRASTFHQSHPPHRRRQSSVKREPQTNGSVGSGEGGGGGGSSSKAEPPLPSIAEESEDDVLRRYNFELKQPHQLHRRGSAGDVNGGVARGGAHNGGGGGGGGAAAGSARAARSMSVVYGQKDPSPLHLHRRRSSATPSDVHRFLWEHWGKEKQQQQQQGKAQ